MLCGSVAKVVLLRIGRRATANDAAPVPAMGSSSNSVQASSHQVHLLFELNEPNRPGSDPAGLTGFVNSRTPSRTQSTGCPPLAARTATTSAAAPPAVTRAA